MGGEEAKGRHCRDMEGRKKMEEWKQGEMWSNVMAQRRETAFSVACMLYKRLFVVQGGGTGKTWRKAGVIFCAS